MTLTLCLHLHRVRLGIKPVRQLAWLTPVLQQPLSLSGDAGTWVPALSPKGQRGCAPPQELVLFFQLLLFQLDLIELLSFHAFTLRPWGTPYTLDTSGLRHIRREAYKIS